MYLPQQKKKVYNTQHVQTESTIYYENLNMCLIIAHGSSSSLVVVVYICINIFLFMVARRRYMRVAHDITHKNKLKLSTRKADAAPR